MTHQPPDASPAAASLRRVQRTIAQAVRSTDDLRQLGDVHLLAHQRRAAAQLRRILAWHHGALLADEVGMGKTYSALAVAERYGSVHVLAPAGLLAMWQAALLRTGQRHVRVHSLHGCSRRPPRFERGDSTLVIVDEAHHLRHRNTARYRHVSHAVAGCHVLLLSATPLHNRPADLRTLFALFRGDRDDSLRDDTLATLIVRRTARDLTLGSEATRPPLDGHPRVAEHRPWHVPQDRATLDLLLALPAPLPAHDGAVAGALIRLGLLRAWCSSDAALDAALTRRLQRGEAMREALAAGRHPTTGELAAWITGDDATQLAFPELLVEHTVHAAPLLDTLDRHLAAVRALRAHHRHAASGDPHRAAHLRELRTTHPHLPVVAFSQQARTVQALYRALSDIAGVGLLTADGGRIASGPIPRHALLEAFAPRAHGRPPPSPATAVWLLLTTDLLAEGVNLQDAGVVVHLDLPWTAALREQRVGRAARLGSPHTTVHVYRFAPDAPARRALRLEARLARKLAHAERLVGATIHQPNPVRGEGDTPCARSSAAVAQAAWQRHLDEWAALPGDEGARPQHRQPDLAAVHVPRDAVPHGHVCALVLTRTHDGPRLLAVQGVAAPSGTRRLVSTSVRTFGALAEQIARGVPLEAPDVARLWHRCETTVTRAATAWLRRRRVRTVMGRTLDLQGTDSSAPSPAGQRVLASMSAMLARCAPAERAALREKVVAARAVAMQVRGVAAEQALHRWQRSAPIARGSSEVPLAEVRAWLGAWRSHAVLGQLPGTPASARDTVSFSCRAEVVAVLLLVPAPSAAPVTLEV